MSEEPSKTREQFFIATSEGYISSEHVVAIKDLTGKTHLRTDGGSEYKHYGDIDAPFPVIEKIFTDHGYKFISTQDIAEARKAYVIAKPQP